MSHAPRANDPWTQADFEKLAQLWESNAELAEMAVAMGRSGSGVMAQLAQRGYVYYSQRTQAFHPTAPYMTMRQVQAVDKYIEARNTVHPPTTKEQ
jgi:hypothetical protein